jgi:hypothetical protein
MGLLDDAIREHLELKRRRGADPGEVAREQQEVLDAPSAVQTARPESGAGDTAAAAVHPATGLDEQSLRGNRPDDAPAGSAEQAQVLGETAELDMSSVLGADDEPGATSTSQQPDSAFAESEPSPPDDEDSLEWEVPGEAAQAEQEEPDEDVLEETPEFLRDAPEEDRLWFEQRPPRDFDFDK